MWFVKDLEKEKSHSLQKKYTTWIIIDDKPGNANQARALANALGYQYEVKNVFYKNILE